MYLRDDLPGFYEREEHELSELWREALIVFDTNVYLDLYRLDGQSRDTVLSVLRNIDSGRLWLPYTVAVEFHNRREQVLRAELDVYKQFKSGLEGDVENLRSKLATRFEKFRKNPKTVRRHPFVSETRSIKNSIDTFCDRVLNPLEELLSGQQAEQINRYIDLYEKLLKKDNIWDELFNILDNRLGEPLDQIDPIAWERTCRYRIRNRLPPGFEDKTKELPNRFSDISIWFEMMRQAKESKRSMIFVTNDSKADWWVLRDRKPVRPRPELLNEFTKETGQYLAMYTLDRFIELSKRFKLLNFEKLKIESLPSTYQDIRLLQDIELIEPVSLLELISILFGSAVAVDTPEAYGELVSTVLSALHELPETERAILTARYGLGGNPARSIGDIASGYDVGEEDLQMIEARAIRRLRHPKRSRKIREHVVLISD